MTKKPAKERVPYADRPEVIREFCTCTWSIIENDDRTPIPGVAHCERHDTNPDCPLHGLNAQPAPF